MINVAVPPQNSRQERMQQVLLEAFSPLHLVIENESPNHSVPSNAETHFKVILVSAAFQALSLVKRHQQVYRCLNAEFEGGLHALSLVLFSPDEWSTQGQVITDSPPCRGGHHGDNH